MVTDYLSDMDLYEDAEIISFVADEFESLKLMASYYDGDEFLAILEDD